MIDFHGLPAVQLRAADGAQAIVLLHGAHIVSWRPAGPGGEPGEERLYLSEQAVYADGRAVRGGIPVIFPQFEQRGNLPRHGLARTRSWTLLETHAIPEHACAVLRLSDDAATREHWPYAFEAELTVSVAGARLDVELSATNTGDTTFSFTAALHTYLRVNHIGNVRLAGLNGLKYVDNCTRTEHIETASSVEVDGEMDRLYFHAAQALGLHEPGRMLSIQAQQFDDVVVWNPGPQKCAAIPDMPADGWRHMLCVEAASIGHPVTVAPGQNWTGRQDLTALR